MHLTGGGPYLYDSIMEDLVDIQGEGESHGVKADFRAELGYDESPEGHRSHHGTVGNRGQALVGSRFGTLDPTRVF